MTLQGDAARQRVSRVVVYFISIISLIVLVNTPVPRFILGALLGNPVGDSVSLTLSGYTRDLLLLLLVSLYFEWARSRGIGESVLRLEYQVSLLERTVREYLPAGLRSAIQRDLSVEEVLSAGLARSLSTSKPTDSAVSQILLRQSSLEDVAVAVRIRPHLSRDDLFKVESTMTAMSDVQQFLIGVTEGTDQANVLAAHSRAFFSVVSLGRKPDEHGLVQNYSVSFQSDPGAAFTDVGLSRLDIDARNELVSLPPQVADDEVAVFHAQLPSGRKKIRTALTYDLNRGGGTYGWRADRPMSVQQVVVDASAIHDLVGGRMGYQTFLPDQEQISSDLSDGRLTVHMDSWLFSGHGIVLSW